MDKPLLALTRRPGAVGGRPPREAALENMRQLNQLRWLAVAGQLVAILVAHFGLGVRLPLVPMLVVVGLLALANLLFTLTVRKGWVVRGEVPLALLLDMAALTAQLYLSGGALNPFVSLYLLQVVLGAILLQPTSVWLLVGASSLCFALVTVSHLPLLVPSRLWDVSADLLMVGEWISFVMVAILLVLFITRISRNLRARDAYVVELRQRAVEEDGIVRMGLFASGAAHELGTPLSTLSVLLSDWQRHPAIVANPELWSELDDAQAEVRRCKEIVSNILHSAGLARGEAMGSTAVPELLGEVADEWQAVRDGLILECRRDQLPDVRVAAEPALRQAIWSLLDNAAEAGARHVRLSAQVENGRVSIAVIDDGSGFAPDILARIGRLYQSSKGAGHGLGLFLASNVARRLGGTLEVSNRVDGGAAVVLHLPAVTARTGGFGGGSGEQAAGHRRG